MSSSFGEAGGDQVTFTADGKRLATASLTAEVAMQSCTARGCTGRHHDRVGHLDRQRPDDDLQEQLPHQRPGQFHSTGRFSGSSRMASATGTVPVLGNTEAVFASISSGRWTDRTICHGC